MAASVSKTSPREAKDEAWELGRAAGRAVPHRGTWDVPEGAGEGCGASGVLPQWPSLVTSWMTF